MKYYSIFKIKIRLSLIRLYPLDIYEAQVFFVVVKMKLIAFSKNTFDKSSIFTLRIK